MPSSSTRSGVQSRRDPPGAAAVPVASSGLPRASKTGRLSRPRVPRSLSACDDRGPRAGYWGGGTPARDRQHNASRARSRDPTVELGRVLRQEPRPMTERRIVLGTRPEPWDRVRVERLLLEIERRDHPPGKLVRLAVDRDSLDLMPPPTAVLGPVGTARRRIKTRRTDVQIRPAIWLSTPGGQSPADEREDGTARNRTQKPTRQHRSGSCAQQQCRRRSASSRAVLAQREQWRHTTLIGRIPNPTATDAKRPAVTPTRRPPTASKARGHPFSTCTGRFPTRSSRSRTNLRRQRDVDRRRIRRTNQHPVQRAVGRWFAVKTRCQSRHGR